MKYSGLKTLSLIILIISLLGQNVLSVAADELPTEAYITNFIGYAQQRNLTCEARSAADVAAYWGINVTEAEMFDMLPKSTNPEAGFVGNPDDWWGNIPPLSYGVHAIPVARTMRKLGLQAKKGRNLEWDVLRAEIAAGRPVIVWIIGQMWAGDPILFTAEDGSYIITARFEHTMVLTGYSAESVQVFDSYSGVSQSYSLISFIKSWEVLGKQAVIVKGVNSNDDQALDQPETIPDPKAAIPEYYSVQPGEYLILLAERYGLDWRSLAQINQLYYPWILYPGQSLRLR